MNEKLVSEEPTGRQYAKAILNEVINEGEGIQEAIELVFEMEQVGMAMGEDGQDGIDSPRRHGRWPKRPRRSGWTAAERS